MASNRIKVVVAQGVNENMRVVCEFLKENGYEIAGAVGSGAEALEVIERTRPDVVISDLYLTGLDVCAIMDKIKGRLDKTVIVVATSILNGQAVENVLRCGADLFTLIPFESGYMDERIRECVANKRGEGERGVKDRFELLDYVSRLMHEVGVPASIRGYDYIRESIMLALSDRGILKSITKELYPSVAKSNATTASRVERAIRHAVEVAWQRGDVDVLNGIFGYTVKSTKGKPTNGEFISMLAERVRLDLKIS